MERKALGKGLGALIPEREVSIEPTAREPAGLIYLEVEKIRPNPHQPREEFDAESLEELAASIKEKGMIQPILVRRRPDGYELIAGERRLRAAKSLKINKIPAMIKDVRDD
jgi:ParB family chromosome partitioning protein